jgi:hypothetical protein
MTSKKGFLMNNKIVASGISSSVENFIKALEVHGRKIRQTGSGRWLAQCPAHNDGNPSLGVSSGKGRTLVNCFAGCSTDAIVRSLGLSLRDLFDNESGVKYTYRHEGKVVREVFRTPNKQFSQKVYSNIVSLYNPGPIQDLSGQSVWIAEGESDAEVLTSMGLVAVSAPNGASSWAGADYSALENSLEIVIVADRDIPGLKRAVGLFEHLRGKCSPVYIAIPAVGNDAAEHHMAGLGVGDFIRLNASKEKS